CVYCNQLLGISRKKAGTIVRCTNCEGQLIVPEPTDIQRPLPPRSAEQLPRPNPGGLPAKGHPALFERSDFDDLLKPFNKASSSAVAAALPGSSPHAEKAAPTPAPAPTRLVIPAPQPHTVLSVTRGWLSIICVGLIILVGLAFVAGLLVGLSIRPATT